MTSHLSLDPNDLNFSILPPNDLLSEWEDDILYSRENIDITLLKAYQAGADAELEACVEWMGDSPVIWRGDPEEHPGFYLREARRPKPPSLKEEALDQLKSLEVAFLITHGGNAKTESIRRALEQLDD